MFVTYMDRNSSHSSQRGANCEFFPLIEKKKKKKEVAVMRLCVVNYGSDNTSKQKNLVYNDIYYDDVNDRPKKPTKKKKKKKSDQKPTEMTSNDN